jgi:hypothetical protein
MDGYQRRRPGWSAVKVVAVLGLRFPRFQQLAMRMALASILSAIF